MTDARSINICQHSWKCFPAGKRASRSTVTGTGGGEIDPTAAWVDRDLLDPGPQKPSHRTLAFGGAAQTRRRTVSPPARFASAGRDTQYESAEQRTSGMVNTKREAPGLTMDESSMTKAARSATTGIKQSVAKTHPPATSTNALVAEIRLTALRSAVAQRRSHPLTPLVADQWETALLNSCLLSRYPQVPTYIRRGAHAGIPHIQQSYTPLNKQSTETLKDVFNEMIQAEFNKGRYLGPFTREELEHEIGPFQSSPLSLVPKAGKPGKYRLIQNLSHPHTNQPTLSINASLNSDDFPCTWGTFRTMCSLIRNLPQGSQAATRDVAEAYRIIPLHENQWPGVVVRISNNPEMFALNTSNSFGGATAGGLFGLFGDALADILRARGIGPILKWVDDFFFVRIPKGHIREYNEERETNRRIVANNGGSLQTGGRLWYKGKTLAEVGAEHFAEDLTFPLKYISDREERGTVYPYGFEEIDEITVPLGIPWETSKDIPFSSIVTFAGFAWDLDKKRVSLPDTKRKKYVLAIQEWRLRPTHTLEDTRKLYGKLLYACHIIPRGRAYLTNLEKMMGFFHDRPFTPRHPPKHLAEDLSWWQNILTRPQLTREIPGNRPIIDVRGFSDASSTTGIGIVLGDKWRAWRLVPGWNAEGRDIGWAEAIAMELLVTTVLQHHALPGFRVYGDNNGVVEGWWTGRSRNAETNRVFRRIHKLLDKCNSTLTTRYVNTAHNPADGPSRGIFPSRQLLLPPINLPDDLKPFIVDFDAPHHPSERNVPRSLPAEPKTILPLTERHRRHQANLGADEQSETSEQTLALN